MNLPQNPNNLDFNQLQGQPLATDGNQSSQGMNSAQHNRDYFVYKKNLHTNMTSRVLAQKQQQNYSTQDYQKFKKNMSANKLIVNPFMNERANMDS